MRVALIAAVIATTLPALAPTAAIAQRYDRDDRGRYDRDYRGNRDGRRDRSDRWAQNDYNWRGDRNDGWDPSRHYQNGNYRERRLGRNDRVYRGGDGRYYCRRNNGSTGLVIGALGGGVLGNVVGGGTLGTILGAGGGALLGRSIDRGNVRCR